MLVARRDFWVRLRERSFLVSTLINLLVLSFLIVLRAVSGGGTPTFELAVVGESPVAERVAASDDAFGMQLDLVPFDDAAAAQAALAAGEVDAVLDGGSLTGLHTVAPQLVQGVQAAAVSLRIEGRIEALGGGADDVAFVGNAAPVEVGVLSPGRPEPRPERRDRVHRRDPVVRAAVRVRGVGGVGRDRGEGLAGGRDCCSPRSAPAS